MTVRTAPFRGTKAIEEVIARMTSLVEWTRKFKPQQEFLRLRRTDLDLIIRWPRAAELHGIVVNESGVWFKGLRLIPDKSEPRYNRPPAPVQSDIE
jgi:predicted secreted Zn-dependent protease